MWNSLEAVQEVTVRWKHASGLFLFRQIKCENGIFYSELHKNTLIYDFMYSESLNLTLLNTSSLSLCPRWPLLRFVSCSTGQSGPLFSLIWAPASFAEFAYWSFNYKSNSVWHPAQTQQSPGRRRALSASISSEIQDDATVPVTAKEWSASLSLLCPTVTHPLLCQREISERTMPQIPARWGPASTDRDVAQWFEQRITFLWHLSSLLTLNRGMSTRPRLSVMEGSALCWAWKWKSSQATVYTVMLATTVKAYLHNMNMRGKKRMKCFYYNHHSRLGALCAS